MPFTPLSSDVMDTIVAGQHGDPFAVLGPHPAGDGTVGVRAFLPAARAAAILTPDGATAPLRLAHPGGLWEGRAPGRRVLPLAYRLRLVDDQGRATEIEDPYRFSPTLSGYALNRACFAPLETRIWLASYCS
jgi:1,4-alpha-glucan branching enzyme